MLISFTIMTIVELNKIVIAKLKEFQKYIIRIRRHSI